MFFSFFFFQHAAGCAQKMKVVLSCLLLFLAAVAQALSATGDRLLTIWEDVEEKQLYSKFLGDLESMYSWGLLVSSLLQLLIDCPLV